MIKFTALEISYNFEVRKTGDCKEKRYRVRAGTDEEYYSGHFVFEMSVEVRNNQEEAGNVNMDLKI